MKDLEFQATVEKLEPDYLAACKFLSIEEALADYEAHTGVKVTLEELEQHESPLLIFADRFYIRRFPEDLMEERESE